MKIKPFVLIRGIVSLSLITYLLWTMRGRLRQIMDTLSNMDILMLTVGVSAALCSVALMAERLKLLFKSQGFSLKYSETLSLTLIGYFFNNFLPTSIGGDFVKAYYVSKKTENKLVSFATVFMDRLFGFLSLFVIAGFIIIFSKNFAKEDLLRWSIFSVLGILALVFLVLWNKNVARFILNPLFKIARWPKAEDMLKKGYEAVNSFKDKKAVFVNAFIISVIAQTVCFLAMYFWTKGMGKFLPLNVILITMPMVSILSMLPSINGLGIREGAIVFFLGPHIGYQYAFALSLLWLAMLFLISLIGGVSYAFGTHYRIGLRKEE